MLKPFTVIAIITETGQIVAHHVNARNPAHAFYMLASVEADIDMVVCLPGTILASSGDMHFPGVHLVHAETVLEQPEVFNHAAGEQNE